MEVYLAILVLGIVFYSLFQIGKVIIFLLVKPDDITYSEQFANWKNYVADEKQKKRDKKKEIDLLKASKYLNPQTEKPRVKNSPAVQKEMSQNDLKMYEDFFSRFHHGEKPLLTILLLEHKITSRDSDAKIYKALEKLRAEQREENFKIEMKKISDRFTTEGVTSIQVPFDEAFYILRHFNRRNVISEEGTVQLNNFNYNENEKKLFFDPETHEKEQAETKDLFTKTPEPEEKKEEQFIITKNSDGTKKVENISDGKTYTIKDSMLIESDYVPLETKDKINTPIEAMARKLNEVSNVVAGIVISNNEKELDNHHEKNITIDAEPISKSQEKKENVQPSLLDNFSNITTLPDSKNNTDEIQKEEDKVEAESSSKQEEKLEEENTKSESPIETNKGIKNRLQKNRNLNEFQDKQIKQIQTKPELDLFNQEELQREKIEKAEAENRKFQEQFLEHQKHLNSIMDVVTNIQKQMTTKHDEKEDSFLKQQLDEKQAEVERLIAA